MSLFTPVEMPSPLRINSKVFDLNTAQNITPVGSGFTQTIERVRPLWLATYMTPPLVAGSTAELDFQAFLDALQGSYGTFLGYDPRRPRPIAYALGATETWRAVLGTPPVIDSADHDTQNLTIKGLAVGAIITRGDFISFQRSNAWHLHRVIVGATASGSGIASVSVVPPPVTSTTDVNARMSKACAAMKILGGVTKNDKVDDPGPSYQFQAYQFIDRS